MGRFLVTGGAGFIGSHLVEALVARGDTVRILDDLSTGHRDNLPASPAVELVIGDAADPDLVARVTDGMTGCFHLAAIASVQRSNEDWYVTHRANLSATVAVLDAARRASPADPLPVVYASSAAIYGDNDEMPLAETALPRPLTAYGADKLGSEQHARVGWLQHRIRSTGFRFFNVYGPRQDPKSPYSGVIAIFADRVARGEPITINGDGLQTRDFVYVGDVVRHLIAAMDTPAADARVFNVCTGRVTTVADLARVIADIAGCTADIRHGPPRAGDIRRSLGNPAAAAKAFGFTADVLVPDGLRRTLTALQA